MTKFDPYNVLPVDPGWVHKFNEAADHATALLDCMVVMIALQENGKIGLTVAGVPTDGPLSEFAKDVPQMLVVMASMLQTQHEQGIGNLDS